MVIADNRRQCVLEQDMRLYIRHRLERPECEDKIYLALCEQFHKLVHLLINDVQLYCRIHLHERNDRFRQNGAEGMSDPDIESPRKEFLQIVNAVGAGFSLMKCSQRERQHHLSSLGQSDGVAAADEKPCPEFILQLLDLLRERTLGYVQAPCRIGEVQGLGGFGEIS